MNFKNYLIFPFISVRCIFSPKKILGVFITSSVTGCVLHRHCRWFYKSWMFLIILSWDKVKDLVWSCCHHLCSLARSNLIIIWLRLLRPGMFIIDVGIKAEPIDISTCKYYHPNFFPWNLVALYKWPYLT